MSEYCESDGNLDPKARGTMRLGLLLHAAGLGGISMALGTSAYQFMVEVPYLSTSLPGSAAYFQACLQNAPPTPFHLTINMLAAAAIIGSLGVNFSQDGKEQRVAWSLAAIATIAANVAMTVLLIHPASSILFFDPVGTHPEDLISATARSWKSLHLARVGIYAMGAFAAAEALLVAALDRSIAGGALNDADAAALQA